MRACRVATGVSLKAAAAAAAACSFSAGWLRRWFGCLFHLPDCFLGWWICFVHVSFLRSSSGLVSSPFLFDGNDLICCLTSVLGAVLVVRVGVFGDGEGEGEDRVGGVHPVKSQFSLRSCATFGEVEEVLSSALLCLAPITDLWSDY